MDYDLLYCKHYLWGCVFVERISYITLLQKLYTDRNHIPPKQSISNRLKSAKIGLSLCPKIILAVENQAQPIKLFIFRNRAL